MTWILRFLFAFLMAAFMAFGLLLVTVFGMGLGILVNLVWEEGVTTVDQAFFLGAGACVIWVSINNAARKIKKKKRRN